MNSPQPIIAVQHLSKSFNGKPAVVDVELNVLSGEIFGFLGPNGGGKTTTIRMLCGLLIPDSCEGNCLGFDILREASRIKENVGYMTQNFSLYEELTIRENLDFAAHLYQIKNRHTVVNQAIQDLGLTARQDQLVKTLSGGWKQRLALTVAILHKPRLLLLDEPTAGIDPQARREFWEYISELTRNGITVLVSTHYMDEAERCHRLAYIAQGRILARGTKDEIITQSELTTVEVTIDDMAITTALIAKLKGQHDIEQVATFGNDLHVSGKNLELIKQNLLPLLSPETKWQIISPSLEDVFISLVKRSTTKIDATTNATTIDQKTAV